MTRRLYLSGFILCAIFLSNPSPSDAQSGCTWTLYQNTLIYGGNGSNTASSLSACQSLCLNTSQCVAVDWDPNNPGSKCYLQKKKTDKVFNQTGVSHYDYDCNGTVATVTGSSSTSGTGPTTISGTTIQSGPSGPTSLSPASGCTWTLYQNTLIYGGNGSNTASSLSACQSLCLNTAQCVAVDWDPNNPGSKCYLQKKKSDKVFNQTGVSHYDYDCNGTVATVTGSSSTSGSGPTGPSGATSPSGPSGPSIPPPSSPPPPTVPPAPACRINFEYAYNTTSVGGLFISEITSLLQCFDSCLTLPNCLGYDLSGPDYSLCWLYFNPENFRQKYFKLNVLQYSINRCPEQDVAKCIPSYDTNNVLNDSCATTCYPEWRRYDNYAGASTGSWQETPPWNFKGCLSDCVENPGCIGVELRNQPGIPSACRYYRSADRNALMNLTLTAFVTQYSIVNTCVKKCNVTWEKLSRVSIRFINPTPMPNIASEGDCLKACRISSTCLAAQWRIGVDPGCTLTDEYIPNTQIPNGAAVTYVYRESCPEPPPLPTPPANGNSSITTGRGFGSTTFAGGSGNSSASSTISGSNTGSSLSPGFGTSFPASGSTTSSSGPTCWVLTKDTNFLQGVANIATNVSQCQAACRAQTSPLCIAVDWDTTRPSGSQCFLNSIAQNKNSAPGVDHYDYVCANSSSATGSTIGSSGSGNSAGSSAASVSSTTFLQLSSTTAPSQSCWLQMNDTLIPRGLDNNATSVTQCQAACRAQTSPKCLSVDWDKTRTTGSQCFLHSTSQGKSPATGVDHYDLICM